jgi:selenocysteine-specific elongation factor
VRAGSETFELPAETRRHIESLGNELRNRGVAFASRSEVEAAWKGSERFADALQLLKDSGEIVEMGDAGLMHRDAVDRAVEALKEILAKSDELSVGDIKDALGLTRKHAIPLLEYFDERKITVRSGNARRRGPAFPGL